MHIVCVTYVCAFAHLCVCAYVCYCSACKCIILCNFFLLLLLLIKLAPIEISRSLTPPTGGGSTCTKVVLGGATSSPRPAVAHPRHGTSRQYLTARGSVPPSRPNRPALVVSSIIIYHLSSGVPICLRDIVGIGQSREKFNSI